VLVIDRNLVCDKVFFFNFVQPFRYDEIRCATGNVKQDDPCLIQWVFLDQYGFGREGLARPYFIDPGFDVV
jgi:hypothetical protein